jgi:hypothetical protein
VDSFELTGVVHLARPTGRMAHDLDELRHGIEACEPAALFYHGVQCLLRHGASDDPPPDDFSAWIAGVVQDRETAERLAFAVRDHARAPAPMRAALLEVLDRLPPRARADRDAPEGGAFAFITVDSVSVPTGAAPADSAALVASLLDADDSVWFWHLIEEPWRREGVAPLGEWLRAAGARALAARLEEGARSGLPIPTLRRRVRSSLRRSQLARRVAEAGRIPEAQRREEARSVVAGLVSRITRQDE